MTQTIKPETDKKEYVRMDNMLDTENYQQNQGQKGSSLFPAATDPGGLCGEGENRLSSVL